MELGATSAGSDTRDRLVEAATKEFAVHGYDHASLRQICSAAGVTTGALYFFFKNKEDLFRTVIDPIVTPIGETLAEVCGNDPANLVSLAQLMCSEDESEGKPLNDLLKLCYSRRDLVLIMVQSTECSVMEELRGGARATIARGVRSYVEERGDAFANWDDLMIDWVSTVALSSVFEVLRVDDSIEKARRHIFEVSEFIQGGVQALAAKDM